MTHTRTGHDWVDRTVYDSNDHMIGDVDNICIGHATGRPEWMTVRIAQITSLNRIAPLAGTTRNGRNLRIGYTADHVTDAPSLDGKCSFGPEHERRLYAHYALNYADHASCNQYPSTPSVLANPAGDLLTSIISDLQRRHPTAQSEQLRQIAIDAIQYYSTATVPNFVPFLARRLALETAKAMAAPAAPHDNKSTERGFA